MRPGRSSVSLPPNGDQSSSEPPLLPLPLDPEPLLPEPLLLPPESPLSSTVSVVEVSVVVVAFTVVVVALTVVVVAAAVVVVTFTVVVVAGAAVVVGWVVAGFTVVVVGLTVVVVGFTVVVVAADVEVLEGAVVGDALGVLAAIVVTVAAPALPLPLLLPVPLPPLPLLPLPPLPLVPLPLPPLPLASVEVGPSADFGSVVADPPEPGVEPAAPAVPELPGPLLEPGVVELVPDRPRMPARVAAASSAEGEPPAVVSLPGAEECGTVAGVPDALIGVAVWSSTAASGIHRALELVSSTESRFVITPMEVAATPRSTPHPTSRSDREFCQ